MERVPKSSFRGVKNKFINELLNEGVCSKNFFSNVRDTPILAYLLTESLSEASKLRPVRVSISQL